MWYAWRGNALIEMYQCDGMKGGVPKNLGKMRKGFCRLKRTWPAAARWVGRWVGDRGLSGIGTRSSKGAQRDWEVGQPGSAYKRPCAHTKDLLLRVEGAGRLTWGLYEGQLGERGTQGGRDHPEESWKFRGQPTSHSHTHGSLSLSWAETSDPAGRSWSSEIPSKPFWAVTLESGIRRGLWHLVVRGLSKLQSVRWKHGASGI